METERKESQKTILKATGVFGFSQVLKILVGLVGSKFVALFLGITGVGIIGLLQNMMSIITAITGFGISISGVRMVSLSHSKNDIEEFSRTVVVLKRAAIVTGFFGFLVTFVLANNLSIWTFGSEAYANWFYVLSFNLIFSSLAVHKMVLLQGTRSIKKIAFSSVVYSVVLTLITIPIYYLFRLDGIVAVLLLSAILNYLVNWFFSRKIKVIPVQVSIKETVSRGKEMIQLGFLLSVNVIFGQITAYLLKLYFNFQHVSESVLGLYVAASTILITYVGLIFNAMCTDFYPRLTIVQKDNAKVKDLVNDQIEVGLLLITPLILVFYLLAPFVIRILYSRDFIAVVLILKLALLAIIIKAIMWPLAFIILAKGEKKLYFKQELLSDTMNIGFTILFYNYLGLVGIGLALLLNYVLYGLYVYYIVKKKFEFNFRKNTFIIICKSIILGVLASIVVFWIDYPNACWILIILCFYSFYLSYIEFDKRIDIKSYLANFRNKF